jgi:hypothetical protein
MWGCVCLNARALGVHSSGVVADVLPLLANSESFAFHDWADGLAGNVTYDFSGLNFPVPINGSTPWPNAGSVKQVAMIEPT